MTPFPLTSLSSSPSTNVLYLYKHSHQTLIVTSP